MYCALEQRYFEQLILPVNVKYFATLLIWYLEYPNKMVTSLFLHGYWLKYLKTIFKHSGIFIIPPKSLCTLWSFEHWAGQDNLFNFSICSFYGVWGAKCCHHKNQLIPQSGHMSWHPKIKWNSKIKHKKNTKHIKTYKND